MQILRSLITRLAFLGLFIGLTPLSAHAQAPGAGSCTDASKTRTFWCTNLTGGFAVNDGINSLIWGGTDKIQTNLRTQVVTQTYRFYTIAATGFFAAGEYFQVHAACGARCTATVSPRRIRIAPFQFPTITVTYRNSDIQPTTHAPTITMYMEGMAPQPITRRSHAYRCDSQTPGRRPGCVFADYEPVEYRQAGLTWISQNIAAGQAKPMHYGKVGASRPLHYDRARQAANRAIACPRGFATHPGTSCDEYPFASTSEGGAVSCPNNCSVMAVPVGEQNSQGGLYSTFLRDNRMRTASTAQRVAGDAFFVYVPARR